MPSGSSSNRASSLAALIAGAGVVVLGLAYARYGHLLVEALYNGEVAGPLGRVLKNRDQHTLGYYTEWFDRILLGASLLAVFSAALWFTRQWRSALVWVCILLAGDLVFGLLSAKYAGWMSIGREWGFPEMFQYVKEVTLAILFLALYRATRQPVYAVFSGLALFLFIDDAFRYHENIGHLLERRPAIVDLGRELGMRANHIGEALSLIPVLLVLGAALVPRYLRADAATRRTARHLVYLVFALGFFGVLIDFVDRLAVTHAWKTVLAYVEDSGEMVVMSLMLAFTAALRWRIAPPVGKRATTEH